MGVLPKFHSKAFLKIHEYPSADDFQGKKDFMAFKQRDLLRSGLLQLTFVRSKLCLPLQRKTRSLCHCFGILGFSCKTNFAYKYQKLIYGEKRKANIFENCTCQQVNKAKNIGDKQRSPRSQPLLTALIYFARSDKENFLIHSELTKTNKALLFFSELGSNINFRRFLLNR